MTRAAAAVMLAAISLASCRTPPRAADAPPPAVDATALDRSVSPCEDFYRFACGGWLDRTEIPPERSGWSRGFAELDERTVRQLRRILEAQAAGRLDERDRFGKKVGDFYASCMDEAGIEARGLADLRVEWAKLDALPDRGAIVEQLARLSAAGLASPFALVADQDARDATQVVLWMYQGGLSLPDRDYYLSDAGKNAEIRERYAAHLRRMLGLAGLPAAEADAAAAAVQDLERALAGSHWTAVEMRDPGRIANRLDRAALAALAPRFPWDRYFQALGKPDVAVVSATTPRFVTAVGALLEEAPLETWKSWLKWRLLSTMAGQRALPRAFVEESFRFESAAFSGATALVPRWKHCVEATDQAVGFALGEVYVRQHFGAGAKERTTALVAEIERALAADLARLAWLDAPTRAAAEAKLAKVVNKVGYPERGRDYSALKVGRESFFRNTLSAGRFEVARQLGKLGKPVDRTEWFMTPPSVNAYYNPSLNEMVFPAGILQPPFFNRAAPDAVNYGAIGMVVGHELTHGFDDGGRKFDGDGNLRDWWTPEVAQAFEARTRCLVAQYAAYEPLPGVKLDGELTLGENIADHGGLQLAFAAHQAARAARPAGAPSERKLEGFTPEQQFFVGYAQSWCSKFRDEAVRLRAATDPHAPPRFRVNGPLSNLPAFQQAFACKEGSPMVRPAAERCEIW